MHIVAKAKGMKKKSLNHDPSSIHLRTPYMTVSEVMTDKQAANITTSDLSQEI